MTRRVRAGVTDTSTGSFLRNKHRTGETQRGTGRNRELAGSSVTGSIGCMENKRRGPIA